MWHGDLQCSRCSLDDEATYGITLEVYDHRSLPHHIFPALSPLLTTQTISPIMSEPSTDLSLTKDLPSPYPPPSAILPTTIPIHPITRTNARNIAFNYYGPAVAEKIITKATEFLTTCTDASPNIATTLTEFLQLTHTDCIGTPNEKSACWFTIRVPAPSDRFDVPRWHQDGRMYAYDQGREDVVRSKYAITLLGRPTLLLPTDQDVLARFRGAEDEYLWRRAENGVGLTREQQDEAQEKLRSWAAAEFEGLKRMKLEKGQVVRFSWGRADSPIHSEPRLDCYRVFVSVLYGSENELRAMCERRREVYEG